MKKTVTKLIEAFAERDLTLALAESMTCGLAAHQLSTVKGTADVLKGSIVCYNEEVKTSLLKVSKALIWKYSAESEEVTIALTKKLRKIINADVYAAITGLSSAGGSETKSKPVGTVFYSVYFQKKYYSERKKFNGTPLTIRKKATENLHLFLIRIIKSKYKK